MPEQRKRSARVKAAPEPEAETPHVCTVGLCPICFVVSALQPIRPEAIGHLLNAGSELLLALRSLIDARSDDASEGAGRGDGRLERIDIA
jgi:hypothetical protein